MMMCALQEEAVQLRGIVVVAYEVGDTVPPFEFELIRRDLHKMKCLPLKIVGGHYCTSNPLMMNVLDLVLHMCTPFFRVRTRAHFGKPFPFGSKRCSCTGTMSLTIYDLFQCRG
jgi:hypothetical protein